MISWSCVDNQIFLLYCHYHINRCYMWYYEAEVFSWHKNYLNVQLKPLSVLYNIYVWRNLGLLVMLEGLLFIHRLLKLALVCQLSLAKHADECFLERFDMLGWCWQRNVGSICSALSLYILAVDSDRSKLTLMHLDKWYCNYQCHFYHQLCKTLT